MVPTRGEGRVSVRGRGDDYDVAEELACSESDPARAVMLARLDYQ